jgi:hypothetical protein
MDFEEIGLQRTEGMVDGIGPSRYVVSLFCFSKKTAFESLCMRLGTSAFVVRKCV